MAVHKSNAPCILSCCVLLLLSCTRASARPVKTHLVGDFRELTNHDELYKTEVLDDGENVRHWFDHKSTLDNGPGKPPVNIVYKYDGVRSSKWNFINVKDHVDLKAGHMFCHHPEAHLAFHKPSAELVGHAEMHDPYIILTAPHHHICMEQPLHHQVLDHKWDGDTLHLHTRKVTMTNVYHKLKVEVRTDRFFNTHKAVDHGIEHEVDRQERERKEDEARKAEERQDAEMLRQVWRSKHLMRSMATAVSGVDELEEANIMRSANATQRAMAELHDPGYVHLTDPVVPEEALKRYQAYINFTVDNCTTCSNHTNVTRRHDYDGWFQIDEYINTGYRVIASLSAGGSVQIGPGEFSLEIGAELGFWFVLDYHGGFEWVELVIVGKLSVGTTVKFSAGEWAVAEKKISAAGVHFAPIIFSIGPLAVFEKSKIEPKVSKNIFASASFKLGFTGHITVHFGVKWTDRNGLSAPNGISRSFKPVVPDWSEVTFEFGGSIKLALENSNSLYGCVSVGPELSKAIVGTLKYPHEQIMKHLNPPVTYVGLGAELTFVLTASLIAKIEVDLWIFTIKIASLTWKLFELKIPLWSGFLCCRKLKPGGIGVLLSKPSSCEAFEVADSYAVCSNLYDTTPTLSDINKNYDVGRNSQFAGKRHTYAAVKFFYSTTVKADGFCYQQRLGWFGTFDKANEIRVFLIDSNPVFTGMGTPVEIFKLKAGQIDSRNLFCFSFTQQRTAKIWAFEFFSDRLGLVGGSTLVLYQGKVNRRHDALFLPQAAGDEPSEADAKENITALSAEQTGMTWDAEIVCPTGDQWHFDIMAIMQPNKTYYEMAMVKNSSLLSNGTLLVNDTYLSTQRLLLVMDRWPVAGMTYRPVPAEGGVLEQFTGKRINDSAFDTTAVWGTEEALNLQYIDMIFSNYSIADLEVDHPAFCLSLGMVTKVFDVRPPQTDEELNELFNIHFEPPKNFANAIRVALGLCLAIAVVAMIGFAVARRWGKSSKTQPRNWLEYGAMGFSIVVCIIVCALGFSGWSSPFAKIEGVTANEDETFDKKTWVFRWWFVEVDSCPQTDDCAPNCNVNCDEEEWTWKNARWPYCPPDKLPPGDDTTDAFNADGSCEVDYPWTVGLYTCLAGACAVATLLSMILMRTKVQRFLVATVFGMLYSMMVFITHQRIVINIRNAYKEFFSPADAMAAPYQLEFREVSENSWLAMVGMSFCMPCIYFLCFLVALYMWYNKIDEDESKWENEPTVGGDEQPPKEEAAHCEPVEASSEPVEMSEQAQPQSEPQPEN